MFRFIKIILILKFLKKTFRSVFRHAVLNVHLTEQEKLSLNLYLHTGFQIHFFGKKSGQSAVRMGQMPDLIQSS